MKNNKILTLTILGLLSLIVITVGVTYAFFNYTKEGTTENSITTGTITFLYTEVSGVGRGISIDDAYPISDSVGKAQTGEGKVFDFKVTSTTQMNASIPYEVTARKKSDSTLDESAVKLYLTKVDGTEEEVLLSKYSDLTQTDRVDSTKYIEKTIYNGKVPANSTNYEQAFRLRMWIAEDTDFSPTEDGTYPYNNKTFTVKVNVYANAKVVTEGDSDKYTEALLNGADPVLTNNLIPVNIANDGTVTKADITKEWYDYETKQWANAVVLKDNIVYDYSKNGRDAELIGNPTYSEEGLVLDGVDDGIYVGDVLKDLFKSSNTVQVKLKKQESAGRSVIIGNYKAPNNINYEVLYGEYRVWFNNGSPDIDQGYASYNDYYLITYIFDKENGTINIYEDDNLVTTMNSSKFTSYNSDFTSVYIGRDSRTSQDIPLNGIIERVMIYDDILTLDEIKKNIDTDYSVVGNDNGVVSDNLILYYDFRSNEVDYNNNEVIPEKSIESYFVWIPKYSYKLWDLGNYSSLTSIDTTKPHSISIKFGLTDTSDSRTGECTTPGVAGESGNCQVGDYMTHPAFLAFDSNGIWVGKFETGYDGATSTTGAEVNSSDSSKIIIKPNVYSWRNATVGNMFKASYDYLRNDESHMMKNTEWGAVAYLHHSSYGSQTSVRVNNNSAYVTGYAATEEPTLGYSGETSVQGNRIESTALQIDGTYTINYLNSASNIASTTGNKTGIYDMSGGAYEYVMGYTTGSSIGTGGHSGITSIYYDFFTNSDWNKYYDKYSSTAITNYNNRILGDATGEMGPFGGGNYITSWYGDFAAFTQSSHPWFYRGLSWRNGSDSGVFAFHYEYGIGYDSIGFRLVLAE